jgi:outer membrane lipoprotein-sorting protein
MNLKFQSMSMAFLAVLLASAAAFSAAQATKREGQESQAVQKLKDLNAKLTQHKAMTAQVSKTTELSLMGRVQKASGKLQVHKGKVRLELNPPEKSLLVVNDKEAWVVTYPPEDFPDAPVEAMVSSLKDSKNNLGLAKILSGDGILEVFEVQGVQSEKGTQTFLLKPKSPSSEFLRAQLTTDSGIELIRELTYWDQLENKVTYKFENMKFTSSAPKAETFNYVPAKDVNVTRL